MTTPQTALVTGGSAGIGEAIARALQREGFAVWVCARREARLAAMRHDGFVASQCDIGRSEDVRRLTAELKARWSRLNVLVNCAAIALPKMAFMDTPMDEVARLIQTNLLGTLSVTQAVLPLMTASGGCIINFSSLLVQRPRIGSLAYAASKGGVEAFTKALAVEVAPHKIRVHCVAPALVRSDIYLAAGMPQEEYDTLLRQRATEFPLGRVGEPEDVAEMVMYLVSDRASWLTGLCVPVDGGGMLR